MALKSGLEEHDLSKDQIVTHETDTEDNTVPKTRKLDEEVGKGFERNKASAQSGNLSLSKTSQRSSDSCDDMLSFVNTPPSRSNLGKKLPPKGVKRMNGGGTVEGDLLNSPASSQNSSGNGTISKRKRHKCSNRDESTDNEVTFKTPLSKEPAGKVLVQKDLESPTDLFSQISPTSLQAACQAAEFASLEESHPGLNSKFLEEKPKSIASSTGFEIEGKIATSTPVAKNSDKNFEVDITPIRWKKDTPTNTESYKQNVPLVVSDVKRGSGLAIRRKAKRFSYPSSSQIRETCPKKIFNFQTTCDKQTAENKKNVTDLSSESVIAKMSKNDVSDNVANNVRSSDKSNRSSEATSVKPFWKRCSTGN